MRTRKWRPHGPGSPSERSLTAETIGKATQKPCPSFEVRFPAPVSRRDYALVSWRQADRRCHVISQNTHVAARPNRAISGREADPMRPPLTFPPNFKTWRPLRVAIFFLAFITLDPGRRARYGESAPYRMTYRPDTRSDTATSPPVPGCRWPSPRGPWWETAPGCRRREPVHAERLRLRSG